MLGIRKPAASSYSTDHHPLRLKRHASIDSLVSRITISSVASSTRAQPASIISYSTESVTSTGESIDTPTDDVPNGYHDSRPFYVFCLYDFESDDPNHVSFKKNDILKIVRCDPSGWWAAEVESHVGWIPSAFVVPVEDEMAIALQNVRPDLRTFEFESKSLYRDQHESNLPWDGSSLENRGVTEYEYDDGIQVITGYHSPPSPHDIPTDVTPDLFSQFDPPNELPSTRSPTREVDTWQALSRAGLTLNIPQGVPRTSVPPKLSAPAPFASSGEGRRPLRVDTNMLLNKPTPPTPVIDLLPSSSPVLSEFPPARHLPRSRSLGSFTTTSADHRRRDDGLSTRSVLANNQLSTLPEGLQDDGSADEVESPTSRGNTRWRSVISRPPKVLRITGDDDAQAFQNAQLAQASQPWYLRPHYASNEIKVEYDGSVKAGTLEALVERLTVEPLRLEQENAFRQTFLTTFRTFSTADRVLDLLIRRYELETPEGLTHDQFMEWMEKKLRKTQARVLHVFKIWVEEYGLVEDDPQIVTRLRDFLGMIRSPPTLSATARQILSILDSRRQSDDNVSPIMLSTPTSRARRIKNDLLRIDPGELARQLTLYESRLYIKVRPHECLTWAETQKGERVQNLRSFVSTCDKLAAWVKMSVLNNDALGKRADTIELWIKVADKCRALRNYSSISAIVAALTSQVIAQLQLTWAHVNKASHLDPIVKLFEPTNNFSTCRHLLTSTEDPCVPFIGIYLSDMVKISDTAPDFKASGSETSPEASLINFTKRQKMAETGQAILRHQPKVRDQYKLTEVTPIMQFVEAQLKVAAGKDEGGFWMRSHDVQQAELAHADIRKGLEAAGF